MLKIRFKIIEYGELGRVIGVIKFSRKASDIFRAMDLVEECKKLYENQDKDYVVTYEIKGGK